MGGTILHQGPEPTHYIPDDKGQRSWFLPNVVVLSWKGALFQYSSTRIISVDSGFTWYILLHILVNQTDTDTGHTWGWVEFKLCTQCTVWLEYFQLNSDWVGMWGKYSLSSKLCSPNNFQLAVAYSVWHPLFLCCHGIIHHRSSICLGKYVLALACGVALIWPEGLSFCHLHPAASQFQHLEAIQIWSLE